MTSPVVRDVESLPPLRIRNREVRAVGLKRANPGWTIGPGSVKVWPVSGPTSAVVDGVQGILVAVPFLSEFRNGPTDIAYEF